MLLLVGMLLLALLVAPSAWAGTFTVSNGNNDSGLGSLRHAINAVNADTSDSTAAPDTIMVSGGPFTLVPGTQLPAIQRPVVLEGAGLTINDATASPTFPPPAANDALVLQTGSDGSTVSGLTIVGAAAGAGIAIVSSGDTITQNTIGSAAAGNEFGITVFSSNNTIGGAASAGNVISGKPATGSSSSAPTGPDQP